MIVLGFDLSLTATGIAEPGRLSTYKTKAKGDRRLEDITHELRQITGAWRPVDLIVIEGAVLRSQAAIGLAMLHGAVRLELIRQRIPYLIVPPATLKTYATGRGNAQKPDMRMELYKRTGEDVADDNQVDAMWLRLLGLDSCGIPDLDLPQTHRRALTKLPMAVSAA